LCRPGIKALIEIAGRDNSRLRENDIGYAIAPRLNAAGRLDDMSLGIECLLSNSPIHAAALAGELDALNTERRQIEAEMKAQAFIAIDALTQQLDHNKTLPIALCLLDKTWHQGVIGILAGRLKERFHRPVIAFAFNDDNEIKGSARSVPGLNIRDVLAGIDKDNPGLITKFGGHAMAAGVSLHPDNFKAFQSAFIANVAQHWDASACEGLLWTDGSLELDHITLTTAALIQEAGPWGQQFPEPCFDNEFDILEQRVVGQNHLKLTLVHPEGGAPIDAIAFNVDRTLWPNHRVKKVHIAYKLDDNRYLGRSRLQLLIEALHPL
jgi:single-stranded-DNA-specific exonuclease